MNHSQRVWNHQSNKYIAWVVIMLSLALAWFFWPSKVKLSPDTYKITMALYRVCNQQDVEGLQQIQSELSQRNNAPDTDKLRSDSVEERISREGVIPVIGTQFRDCGFTERKPCEWP